MKTSIIIITKAKTKTSTFPFYRDSTSDTRLRFFEVELLVFK